MLYLLRRLASFNGVAVALRHLLAVEAGHLGRFREQRVELGEDQLAAAFGNPKSRSRSPMERFCCSASSARAHPGSSRPARGRPCADRCKGAAPSCSSSSPPLPPPLRSPAPAVDEVKATCHFRVAPRGPDRPHGHLPSAVNQDVRGRLMDSPENRRWPGPFPKFSLLILVARHRSSQPRG